MVYNEHLSQITFDGSKCKETFFCLTKNENNQTKINV